MKNPKFTISKDVRGEFRFVLRAANGEIILRSSEGYDTNQGCRKGIASTKVNAPYDERYFKATATNNQYYFALRAGNHETLGISETYTSTAARDNGVKAVKRDAPDAPIEDLTRTNSLY